MYIWNVLVWFYNLDLVHVHVHNSAIDSVVLLLFFFSKKESEGSVATQDEQNKTNMVEQGSDVPNR